MNLFNNPMLAKARFVVSGCYEAEVGKRPGLYHWDTSPQEPMIELNYIRIWCIREGYGTYCTKDGETVELKAGRCYLVLPDTIHSTRCPEYMRQYYLQFKIEGVPSRLEDMLILRREVAESERILSLLDIIHNDFTQDSVSAHFSVYGGILALLGEFVTGTRQLNTDTRFEDILDYIDSHCTADISIDRLAKRLGYTKEYFSVRFRTLYNTTALEYIIGKRIGRAQDLLSTTDLPIGEIAQACGYSDPLYFSRLFRRRTLLSPREYRRKAREEERTMISPMTPKNDPADSV